MKLRPYQEQAIEAVIHDWQTTRHVLGVAATGAGKTVIFLELLRRVLQPGQRALILAHRQELIDQPIERTTMWPNWPCSIGAVQAERDECHAQIVVATIQTLQSSARLQRLLDWGRIDYLITDEAHHATAASYQSIYAQLEAANSELRHLGVTATPLRADGDGLIRTFSHVSFKEGIRELVPHYLAAPRWMAIATGVSLKGIKTTAGDFNAGQLAQRFENEPNLDLVVQTHHQYAPERKAICFTVSVDGAHTLARLFTAAGYRAAAIDGTTPKDERKRILAAFGRGDYQILANCAVLTEGFDDPSITCVHMVRPTKSDALYTQCIGRGLRLYPGKDDCIIFDYVPEDVRNIAMLGNILGVPQDIMQAATRPDAQPGEVQLGFLFDGEVRGLSNEPLEIIATSLNYLDASPWLWQRREGWLMLDLGRSTDDYQRMLAITPPDAEPFRLYGLTRAVKGLDDWHARMLYEHPDFGPISDHASEIAEKWAVQQLASKSAFWLTQPATESQIKFLRRLSHGEGLRDLKLLTKGQAGELITFYQARQALERVGAWR